MPCLSFCFFLAERDRETMSFYDSDLELGNWKEGQAERSSPNSYITFKIPTIPTFHVSSLPEEDEELATCHIINNNNVILLIIVMH